VAVKEELDPSKLIADGWVYRDVPWCTLEAWDTLMSVPREGSAILLAMSRRPNGDTRGQILYSPEALDDLAAYRKGHQ
jgi:hypothetical protein